MKIQMVNIMIKTVVVIIYILSLSMTLEAKDIYIIYTSNANGMIENCGCGSDPLGGIGRVKSYIDQFRNDHKNVLVIDGGDFFNSYPFPKLNESMFSSLLLMQYDCLVPGDQAFVEGSDFFYKYASNLKDKLLLSNSTSELRSKMSKTYGSYRIQIYGYLSPYVFDFIEKPDNLGLMNFVDAKPQPAKQNELQVAIIHGYLSNAEQFAVENSSIRLILLAHDQRKGVWKKKQATIIGNGKDSEYISIIQITPGNQWLFTVEQQKIHEDMPEDDQIVKIIKEYKTK